MPTVGAVVNILPKLSHFILMTGIDYEAGGVNHEAGGINYEAGVNVNILLFLYKFLYFTHI